MPLLHSARNVAIAGFSLPYAQVVAAMAAYRREDFQSTVSFCDQASPGVGTRHAVSDAAEKALPSPQIAGESAYATRAVNSLRIPT